MRELFTTLIIVYLILSSMMFLCTSINGGWKWDDVRSRIKECLRWPITMFEELR